MSFLKSFLFRMQLLLKTVQYTIRNHNLPNRFVHDHVPYFAQWESRELVGRILEGTIRAEDDPKWKGSGAETKAEYAIWSWSSCGMACLKMLLAHRNNTIIPIVALGKKCAKYGGYDMPLETSTGLKYRPFVEYLKKEFQIAAKVIPVLPQVQVRYGIAQGKYVIASVSPMIRDVKSQPTSRGGHLVLVLGFSLRRQEFYLHNPSGGSVESEAYAAVSFKDFEKFFSHRGIVISD